MQLSKSGPNPSDVSKSILLALTILVLLGSATTANASAYSSLTMESQVTVSSPLVILQNGTTGTSTIGPNNTSAEVSVSAPKENNTEDFVDAISNIDDSPDIGSHSNFTTQQYADSIYDTLTEGDTSGENVENDIDNNTSDVDISVDKGTETSFSNAQGTTLDSNCMNITEYNYGGTGLENWFSPNNYSDPNNAWSTENQAYDENTGTAASATAGTQSWTPYLYLNYTSTTGNKMQYYVDVGSTGSVNSFEIDIWNTTASAWNNVQTDGFTTNAWTNVTFAQTTSDCMRLRFYNKHKTQSYLVSVYEMDYLSVSPPPDFEVDFEYEWTTANFASENEEFCIYVLAHNASETLNVNYRNGSSWSSLGVAASTGWNNLTAIGLSSSTYSIQIVGASEDGDATRDSWDIDVIVLHTWNASSYQLDLEVQWTNADFDETFEELAIYADIKNNTYSLDATGGYMIVGNGAVDWGSTEGTISFWMKMDGSVQGRLWGQNDNMETRWSGTNLLLDWGGTGSMTSAYSFSAYTWFFVAIVWDENNDNLHLYIGDEANPPTLDENSLSGTWTGTTPVPTENRFLNGLGGDEPVDGHGDDLRYWNIARNQTEIQSDYNIGLAGTEANLRSYFKLNNNLNDTGPDNNDSTGYDGYSFSLDVPFFTENIQVDVWNGSTWQSALSSLTYGWNNASVTAYLTTSNFTIRFKGGNETSDTFQDSWSIDAALLNTCTFTETTYDYVLRVNNTVTDAWEIRLKKYSDSSVSRLQNCTIYFHNFTDGTSAQIAVKNGSFESETGPWYDLDSLETIYIAMTVKANSMGTAYVYAYLEIRAQGTNTYVQYKVAFAIT